MRVLTLFAVIALIIIFSAMSKLAGPAGNFDHCQNVPVRSVNINGTEFMVGPYLSDDLISEAIGCVNSRLAARAINGEFQQMIFWYTPGCKPDGVAVGHLKEGERCYATLHWSEPAKEDR